MKPNKRDNEEWSDDKIEERRRERRVGSPATPVISCTRTIARSSASSTRTRRLRATDLAGVTTVLGAYVHFAGLRQRCGHARYLYTSEKTRVADTGISFSEFLLRHVQASTFHRAHQFAQIYCQAMSSLSSIPQPVGWHLLCMSSGDISPRVSAGLHLCGQTISHTAGEKTVTYRDMGLTCFIWHAVTLSHDHTAYQSSPTHIERERSHHTIS